MQEEGVGDCLQEARRRLAELGLQAVALMALDRPSLDGREWKDESVLVGANPREWLASFATEMAAQGLFDGTRSLVTPSDKTLHSISERGWGMICAPSSSPRMAAIIRPIPNMETYWEPAAELLAKVVSSDESIEMAAALCEVTGASAVLLDDQGEIKFVSRSAFVQQGANGPFLGLSCLSKMTPEVLVKLQTSIQEGSQGMRRGRVGDMTMVCFVRRIGENNLAVAASRFGLTRAELAESESMIAGLSCKESAARLKISPETVRQRRKVIYRKLGVESCGTAVARILELELPSSGSSSSPSGSISSSSPILAPKEVRQPLPLRAGDARQWS